MKREAKQVYFDEFSTGKMRDYNAKYKFGKNEIDQYLEIYLLNEIKNNVSQKDLKVLELGVFSGRVNNMLKKYWNDITVTEVKSEMLLHYPKSFVLDLASSTNDLNKLKNSFDICVSLGHQVSFSCEIENSFNIISSLLKSRGYFFLDIWNKNCGSKFDPLYPSYEISKSNYSEVVQIAEQYGLRLISFYYGQKLFYISPRLWIVAGKIFGEIFYKTVTFLEKKFIGANKFKFPAQNLYFLFQKCG